MEQLEETNFDVIIVGTGITEAILAGAIARIGKKVLHLDKNDFYGCYSSSFNLKNFDQLMKDNANSNTESYDQSTLFGTPSPDRLFPIFNTQSSFMEVSSPKTEIVEEKESSKTEEVSSEPSSEKTATVEQKSFSESMLDEYRQYNIDITPRLQFSSGPEIELLISSGVARYLEYKPLESIYIFMENALQTVPCSKGDIFKNKFVSLLEKRLLTKFITYIRNEMEGGQEEQDQTISKDGNFLDFLKAHSLTPKLIAFVLYAISIVPSEQKASSMSAVEGLERIKRFVASIGRYGSTPFITPLYGLSEVCQAYCRLSAVYGGIYMLRKSIKEVKVDDTTNKVTQIVDSDGQTLSCETLVLNIEFAPKLASSSSERLSRCVVVSDGSIQDQQQQIMAVFPPNAFGNKSAIHVLQYGPEMYVCPKNKYLLHFTTAASGTAKEDLEGAVKSLFKKDDDSSDSKPRALYVAYYNQSARAADEKKMSEIPSNVFVISDPDFDIDSTKSVKEARAIFSKLYPNEQFLPKAHEEEDMVWEDESTPSDSLNEPPSNKGGQDE